MAEEKKGFFKKLGDKLDKVQLENDLKTTFKKANKSFTLYKAAKMLEQGSFGVSAEDHLDEGYIVALTEEDYDDSYLLGNDADKKVYLIDKVEDAKVTIAFEGNEYERNAKKIYILAEATKVNVIKAGDSYYLAKEK